jgi:hypothetical protein
MAGLLRRGRFADEFMQMSAVEKAALTQGQREAKSSQQAQI